MIIASEKRKTNIAEYVIYLWHIEDIIRACKLDMDIVRQQVVAKYEVDENVRSQIADWYESLIQMMKEEKVVEKGHLQLTLNAVSQMEELHQLLLTSPEENRYRNFFYAAQPNIIAYRARSNNSAAGDILVCLEALYMLLLMRLSKKEVSLSTQEAMDTFSHLLALLSQKFIEWENGTLNL
jgi:hypothetical protein